MPDWQYPSLPPFTLHLMSPQECFLRIIQFMPQLVGLLSRLKLNTGVLILKTCKEITKFRCNIQMYDHNRQNSYTCRI